MTETPDTTLASVADTAGTNIVLSRFFAANNANSKIPRVGRRDPSRDNSPKKTYDLFQDLVDVNLPAVKHARAIGKSYAACLGQTAGARFTVIFSGKSNLN
jgi:hypothetical protein